MSQPDSSPARETADSSHPLTSPSSWPITDESIRLAFESMLNDGSWGRYHGPHCDQLRTALCEFHKVEHTVLCSSGTSAVELALRSVPVGPGDEVILAAYDFKANFVNVLTVGATPVLVDVMAGLPVINTNQLAEACSDKTKAILVSHLHGCFAPMKSICEFAAARGIAVIEDACQNPGALINGRRAGSLGSVGVLSFGGSKLLTAGRGGAVLTSDAAMAQRIKLYTQRGNDAYPLSEMQAAVLLPQLRQLDARNLQRHERAIQIFEHLSESSLVRWIQSAASSEDSPAFYKLPLLMNGSRSADLRNALCNAARAADIPLDPAFHALHLIHSSRRFRFVNDLPNATFLHDNLMTLHHTALLQPQSSVRDMMERLNVVITSLHR